MLAARFCPTMGADVPKDVVVGGVMSTRRGEGRGGGGKMRWFVKLESVKISD